MSTSVVQTKSSIPESLRSRNWYQYLVETYRRLVGPFVSIRETKRVIKYGLVGLLGTTIELMVLNALIFGLGWAGDVEKIVANVIAVSLAVLSNFTWNRLWTFPESRGRNRHTQFAKFASVSVIGLILNSIVFFAADQYIFSQFLPVVYAVQLAKLSAISIVMVWNFGVNRFWTFKS